MNELILETMEMSMGRSPSHCGFRIHAEGKVPDALKLAANGQMLEAPFVSKFDLLQYRFRRDDKALQ